MLRQSRIDTPVPYTILLFAIIVRGIERGKISKDDDQDRYDFINRLGMFLDQTETGSYPVATAMR